MKSNLILSLLSILTFPALSQVDYLDFKNRHNLSCTIADSATIVRTQHLMDSLQSFEITNGEEVFLYDYGWTYYMRYMKWKNPDDLKAAARNFEKGWAKYQDLVALWNLGGIYRALGNCEKSLDMTELYLDKIPDSVDVDYQQVYYRYKHCRSKK